MKAFLLFLISSSLFATSLPDLFLLLSTNNPSLLQLKSQQKAARYESDALAASMNPIEALRYE